jgi:hypothetical protein
VEEGSLAAVATRRANIANDCGVSIHLRPAAAHLH